MPQEQTRLMQEAQHRKARLPGPSDRTVVIGKTGSGKSYAGVWLLSMQPVEYFPWLVIDFKGESKMQSIPYAQPIGLRDLPQRPGVYVVSPRPTKIDKSALDEMLLDVLEQENTGLYVDEGYMLENSEPFNTILMQGRSKRIPVIVNTQRPVYLTRYAFSEASFVQVFKVLDSRDKKVISEFTPLYQRDQMVSDELPQYWSWWYDVQEDRLLPMMPAPPIDQTYARLAGQLRRVAEHGKPARVAI